MIVNLRSSSEKLLTKGLRFEALKRDTLNPNLFTITPLLVRQENMSQEMTVLEFEFLCRINAKEWSPTGWSSCKVTQDFFELKRSPYSSLTSRVQRTF
jgi:hypothetical protein